MAGRDATTMTGKTCLVTGASSGIGRAAALGLASLGASVIGVGRDPGRCAEAGSAIREASGNPSVDFLVADMERMDEVRRLSAEVLDRGPTLDVLVNNVGAMTTELRTTPDGFERTFALNHLEPFLLTNLLLDALKAAGPARVVNVSSEGHRIGPFRFEDVPVPARYGVMRAYGLSKLANILFTRELARRFEGTAVTANAMHPGFVNSRFFEGPGLGLRMFRAIAGLVAVSPERGAETAVYLASSPEVAGVSGRYFVKCRQAKPSAHALDDEAARRLWDLSAGLTGLAPAPG